MGYSIVSDAARFGNKSASVIGSHTIRVLTDAAGDAFLDARTLYRDGVNLGPTIANTGSGSVSVYGTLSDPQYIQDPRYNTNPAYVKFGATALAVLASGDSYSPSPKIFSGFKFTFSGPGEVVCVTV